MDGVGIWLEVGRAAGDRVAVGSPGDFEWVERGGFFRIQ